MIVRPPDTATPTRTHKRITAKPTARRLGDVPAIAQRSVPARKSRSAVTVPEVIPAAAAKPQRIKATPKAGVPPIQAGPNPKTAVKPEGTVAKKACPAAESLAKYSPPATVKGFTTDLLLDGSWKVGKDYVVDPRTEKALRVGEQRFVINREVYAFYEAHPSHRDELVQAIVKANTKESKK